MLTGRASSDPPRMHPLRSAPRIRPHGFTLLEVLVAMVVMALGVLGVLGLRMVTLKHGDNAQARAVASIQAAEILDRMRANPVRAAGGLYNIGLDAAEPALPSTIAAQDLQQWRRALARRLAGGTGSVSVNAAGMAEVAIRWTERDTTRQGERTLIFTFRSQL